mgnify:CR=1 FL=1
MSFSLIFLLFEFWKTESNLQDFTLDMYFRQFWQDPRLSFEKREGLEKLVVGAEYINLIWVPDTFFVNEKTAYFHKATTENQFLRILHTGEILRSIRYCIFYFSLSMCISANAALWKKKYENTTTTADSSDERREPFSMLFSFFVMQSDAALPLHAAQNCLNCHTLLRPKC